MGRPLDKHIDEQELNALVPSHSKEAQRACASFSAASLGEAERHLAYCAECRRKVAQYRYIVERTTARPTEIEAPQPGCPVAVDWHDVAAGLWPEARTEQLIAHAARCAHCGPLLRAAASDEAPTPVEEQFLAQLNAPSRPAPQGMRVPTLPTEHFPIWRQLWDWKVLVPAGALLLLFAVVIGMRSSSPLSGSDLAQFAVGTHRQHIQRRLDLELHSDSQRLLNEWLHQKPEFSVALPLSSEFAGEALPYRLEGARMVKIRNKTAVYVAFQMQADPVSLIVAPVSVAVASGGVEAAFNKVTFHYYSIHEYKVVTWSVHGLTYALVSGEGNKTQRSCMVCHSAMRDRDLTDTPTPLADPKASAESFLQ